MANIVHESEIENNCASTSYSRDIPEGGTESSDFPLKKCMRAWQRCRDNLTEMNLHFVQLTKALFQEWKDQMKQAPENLQPLEKLEKTTRKRINAGEVFKNFRLKGIGSKFEALEQTEQQLFQELAANQSYAKYHRMKVKNLASQEYRSLKNKLGERKRKKNHPLQAIEAQGGNTINTIQTFKAMKKNLEKKIIKLKKKRLKYFNRLKKYEKSKPKKHKSGKNKSRKHKCRKKNCWKDKCKRKYGRPKKSKLKAHKNKGKYGRPKKNELNTDKSGEHTSRKERPVPVTGPYIVYQLRDEEIEEDLAIIRKSLARQSDI